MLVRESLNRLTLLLPHGQSRITVFAQRRSQIGGAKDQSHWPNDPDQAINLHFILIFFCSFFSLLMQGFYNLLG